MRGMSNGYIPAVSVRRYHPTHEEIGYLRQLYPTSQFREDASAPYGGAVYEIHLIGTREVITPEEYMNRCLGH